MKVTAKTLLIPTFYLLVISPFIYYLEAIQSILMILTGLQLLSLTKFSDLKITAKNVPFIGSFFILTFYYLFYFGSSSLKLIGESFLLFLAPLWSYYLYQIDSFIRHRKRIQLAYSISVSLLCMYFIGFYIIDIPNHHFDWYLARYNLEFYCKIHGTYICLWIGIALLFLVDYISDIKDHSKGLKLCFLLLFVNLLLGLIIYNSRNIILGLLVIVIIRFTILKKQKIVLPIKLKVITGLIIAAVVLLSQRYLDAFHFIANDSFANSTRYASWTCSMELINESHFLGMDYSLIQQRLDQCYQSFDNFELKKFRINSHNQYLDFLLKGGFLLLVTFLWTLFLKIKEALKQQQYLYLSITILFLISFITENILVRQYGIYIYFVCDVLLLGAVFRNKDHSIHEIEKS
ncbi:O-antigen ligase family protein [Flavobacterium aquicola]|uniref:O-antigen ligase n=1 Tax=Flavobacterium aquicola TaxID=1682742 RepID=A0A3E0EL19_9FLAO|nr:O-antigen ligase family protein [Flavobacterium aquicola]REG98927.1 O-antigen ligase [Flavobacterium aquicola]